MCISTRDDVNFVTDEKKNTTRINIPIPSEISAAFMLHFLSLDKATTEGYNKALKD